MKIALHLAYFGKNYCGLQIQLNRVTIASELVSALEKSNVIKKEEYTNLKFAGRTDMGVSALQQIATVISDHDIIISQVNHYLPKDIRVLGKKVVEDDFHPRKNALYRVYKYILFNNELDISRIEDAAKKIIGTKSFHNFTKERNKDPVRNILNIKIHNNQNFIFIDIKAQSFLWKQVRKICYVLEEVGKSKQSVDEIKRYFDPNVKISIPSLPSKNLILMKIKYKDLIFEYDKKELNKFTSNLQKQYIKTQIHSEIAKQFRDCQWNI